MSNAASTEFTVPCKLKMSNDDYHGHPAVGSTSLKRILRSPAHYKFGLENQDEPTPALAFGQACHQAILEPGVFQSSMVVQPIFEGKGSKQAREEWFLENHGKTILTQDQFDDIKGMLRSIANHKTARGLLAGGHAEESYFDQCPDTGIIRKARPDFLKGGKYIIDVKTTSDASFGSFQRDIAKFNYHLSAAYYCDVISKVTGGKFDQFLILAVEKTPPYGVSVYLLDEGTMDAGRYLFKKALKLLKEAKEKNEWPAYPDRITSIAIPHWAFPQEEVV